MVGKATLAPDAVKRLVGLSPAGGALAYRSGTVTVGGTQISVIGVDPSTFRSFAPAGTAEATAVWESIARGEAVASHDAAKQLKLVLGKDVALAPSAKGTAAIRRLGALATTGVPGSDLIVDDATADALGLPQATAVLLTAGKDVDMDAATNYRGIRGTMHPEVVNIFTRWGLRWGGDWKYTDPMHFELAALLDSPRG